MEDRNTSGLITKGVAYWKVMNQSSNIAEYMNLWIDVELTCWQLFSFNPLVFWDLNSHPSNDAVEKIASVIQMWCNVISVIEKEYKVNECGSLGFYLGWSRVIKQCWFLFHRSVVDRLANVTCVDKIYQPLVQNKHLSTILNSLQNKFNYLTMEFLPRFCSVLYLNIEEKRLLLLDQSFVSFDSVTDVALKLSPLCELKFKNNNITTSSCHIQLEKLWQECIYYQQQTNHLVSQRNKLWKNDELDVMRIGKYINISLRCSKHWSLFLDYFVKCSLPDEEKFEYKDQLSFARRSFACVNTEISVVTAITCQKKYLQVKASSKSDTNVEQTMVNLCTKVVDAWQVVITHFNVYSRYIPSAMRYIWNVNKTSALKYFLKFCLEKINWEIMNLVKCHKSADEAISLSQNTCRLIMKELCQLDETVHITKRFRLHLFHIMSQFCFLVVNAFYDQCLALRVRLKVLIQDALHISTKHRYFDDQWDKAIAHTEFVAQTWCNLIDAMIQLKRYVFVDKLELWESNYTAALYNRGFYQAQVLSLRALKEQKKFNVAFSDALVPWPIEPSFEEKWNHAIQNLFNKSSKWYEFCKFYEELSCELPNSIEVSWTYILKKSKYLMECNSLRLYEMIAIKNERVAIVAFDKELRLHFFDFLGKLKKCADVFQDAEYACISHSSLSLNSSINWAAVQCDYQIRSKYWNAFYKAFIKMLKKFREDENVKRASNTFWL